MQARLTIGGIVPASGASTRMGADDKLSLSLGGVPLVRRAVNALVGAGLAQVCVVVPGGASVRKAEWEGLAGVVVVPNPEPDRGMGHSIALGFQALSSNVDGVAVMPGDLPFVGAGLVAELADRFAVSRRGILVPVHGGRRGHPVFFRRCPYGAELVALDGDRGGRSILGGHPDDVEEWPVDDPAILLDVDTPAELASAREAWGRIGCP